MQWGQLQPQDASAAMYGRVMRWAATATTAAVTWAAVEPELEPATVDLIGKPLDPRREAIGVAL